MEEDIERLEKIIKDYKEHIEFYGEIEEIDKNIKAIQNLIARNKELEQIDKEHQKLNGELQTKLTIAENENHIPRID